MIESILMILPRPGSAQILETLCLKNQEQRQEGEI